jgi:hypothetical protein
MPAVFDDSAWPILRTFLSPVTVESFDAFGAWHAAALKRAADERTVIYIVSDARVPMPSHEVVRHIARWQGTLTEAEFACCALNAVVIDNALARRALTTVNWFKAPLCPQIVVATHREAWLAIVGDFEKRQLPPPPMPPWVDLA